MAVGLLQRFLPSTLFSLAIPSRKPLPYVWEISPGEAIAQSVFNNTQTGIPQTNQRHGRSSIFLKMTAKMFVQMQHHWHPSDLTGVNLGRSVLI
jgi:hypothetical protein